MRGKIFLFILILLFVELQNTDGLLNIPLVNLKPIVKSATGLVNDLAEFTLNEILNFKSFKSLFNKVYATLELENIALLNFLTNQRDVDEHNEKFKSGLVSYRRAVCEYSDMSTDDINKYINRFHMPEIKRNRRKKKAKILSQEMAGNEEADGFEANEPVRSRNKVNRIIPVLETDDSMDGDEYIDPEEEFDPEEEIIAEKQVAPEDYEDNLDYEEYPDEGNKPNLPIHSDEDYKNELLEDKLKSVQKYLSIHSSDDLLNYITEGFDTKVLNQGVCGSCWSFSAAAAIEAAWFIKTGEIVKLSEQQLIDCNRNKDNDGCDGGNMANAFQFVQNNGGISLSSRYPYKGNDTYKCKYVSPDIEVVDHELLDPGDEDLLLKMLIEHGPIAVAIDASLKTFQTYKSGVYYDPDCTDHVNHALLLVGYGTVKATNEDYWIVKNTYGKTWGINGYMKIARNRDNHCGITEFAAFPICS